MNSLYDHGRQKFLEGSIDWLTDNIKCILVNTSIYTVNLGSHQFLTDITGGSIVATSGNLTTPTSLGGVANADPVLFTSVSGSTAGALIIYKDTGTSSTSPLIAYIDTGAGLPVTPNGGNVTIVWSTGSSKIFKL